MDSGTLNLLGIIVNAAGLVFVAWINSRGNKRTASKIEETSNKLAIVSQTNSVENKAIEKKAEVIAEKVDVYHAEVNGKMKKLLETTEELGKAKGKADEKADQKIKDGKK